ncbi:chromosomal replication initiator protein DnaA [Bombilactobacillus thymidiniphilus]|uniref:Chromosomal replication initiator protein DnaA n=1 Tax=Bombilactobacillus thymidiniphilus TaxID=2923363 RepID=A0ABY4PGA0_9LACO|nr:chromosomal replication initiator protein DnaA [Bombilactobacillus thymidiniphilus]UQS84357.1 chromosomal replication initiator protein DnaA [Bombilactobacillus thymidiniphilus]
MTNGELDSFWNFLQEKFKKEFAVVSFQTWIESAKPLKLENNNIYIAVPSSLHKEYWERNISTKVVEAAYEYSNQEIVPIVLLNSDVEKKMTQPTSDNQNKVQPAESPLQKAHLNSKYTFDSFVTGTGNQMAHAAALVVSEEPGTMYNPLFIYGGVGLGKTHLMQAIGHRLLDRNPQANVKYISSESFANDFINSIQNRTQEEFRNEYRTVDLLLVDDIQFFADKEGTQEEFFHTFNTLYNTKKQIVLTSDRLPNEIPKLQERLVSRFKWGLSVDITAPDLETRTAILRKKAIAENLEIPDDALSYIASQIDSNVRELEGALVRVQAYSTMKNSDITVSLAAEALKDLKDAKHQVGLSIDKIQTVVAKYFKISVGDLKGKRRTKTIVVPRQIAMYLARELTDSSLPKIGQEFGGKDHTTVLHSCEKIAKLLESDLNIQHDVTNLRGTLKQ